MLVPTQRDPLGTIAWEELRVQGDGPPAVRASRKLRSEELLITQLSGIRLRMELDKVPLWPATVDHVSIKHLWSLFTQYLYLPRLQNVDVLLNAVRDGVARLTWESETFAYADAWDEASGRYLGLRAGESGGVVMDDRTLVVKPEVARRQIDADWPLASRIRMMEGPRNQAVAVESNLLRRRW